MTRDKYNRMLDLYHFFDTKQAAENYAKSRGWRKYIISSNLDGTCWTLAHTIKHY